MKLTTALIGAGNFARDQGWLASMRAFVEGILEGRDTDHADASDALAAALVTRAALESRESGTTVSL